MSTRKTIQNTTWEEISPYVFPRNTQSTETASASTSPPTVARADETWPSFTTPRECEVRPATQTEIMAGEGATSILPRRFYKEARG